MRKTYATTNNSKVFFYAVILAIIFGIGFIVVQDIQVPTEHISQEIDVKLEK